MAGSELSRHVVVTGNKVLGERHCSGHRTHMKLAAFEKPTDRICKACKERQRKARVDIAKRCGSAN